ncbi:hypothetical protein AB0M43_35835 [Longispora sp. NPDC051575]|uniref:hypothetical protein n=1 Tax=Longispora sp. NPDC051575 TaxID=3154943 RepID=UPI003437EC5C
MSHASTARTGTGAGPDVYSASQRAWFRAIGPHRYREDLRARAEPGTYPDPYGDGTTVFTVAHGEVSATRTLLDRVDPVRAPTGWLYYCARTRQFTRRPDADLSYLTTIDDKTD